MDNKKLLIASSSKHEAITEWIIKNSLKQIDLILIKDLLNQYDIQDQLEDNKSLICWYEKGILKYSNKTHYLLNRVTTVDQDLFKHFKAGDRSYAKREFEAYLGFAFNRFEKVQDLTMNGLCGRIYSLPQQWNFVKKHTKLSIPNYYWGPKDYLPLNLGKNIIHSYIYDFLNWSPTKNKTKLTGFCFERPLGNPLFIFSLGEARLISTEIQLTESQSQNLEKLFEQIKSFFNYFIFELLIFVNQDQFIFGCINLDILRSRHHPLFSAFLHTHLMEEFYRCLN